jgi:hypothetical protein
MRVWLGILCACTLLAAPPARAGFEPLPAPEIGSHAQADWHPVIGTIDGELAVGNRRGFHDGDAYMRLHRSAGETAWTMPGAANPLSAFGTTYEIQALLDTANPIVLYQDTWRSNILHAAVLKEDRWEPADAGLSEPWSDIDYLFGGGTVHDGRAWTVYAECSERQQYGGCSVPNHLRVASYASGAWTHDVAALNEAGTYAVPLGISHDEHGRLMVAWREGAQGHAARRSADGSWEEVPVPAGGPNPRLIDLEDVGGRAHLLWSTASFEEDHELHLARWTSAGWQAVMEPQPAGSQLSWRLVRGAEAPWLSDDFRVLRVVDGRARFEANFERLGDIAGVGGSMYAAMWPTAGGQPLMRVLRLQPDVDGIQLVRAGGELFAIAGLDGRGVTHDFEIEIGDPPKVVAVGQVTERLSVAAAVPEPSGSSLPYRVVARHRSRPRDLVLSAGILELPPGTGHASPAAAGATTSLLIAALPERLRVRRGRTVRVPYVATAASDVVLEVRRRERVVARVYGKARAGRNVIRWDGRMIRKLAPAGSYTLVLRAPGTEARDTIPLRLLQRRQP